jgi:hypothetical protein
VVALTATEFARVKECMGNPGARRKRTAGGAELLRKLYDWSRFDSPSEKEARGSTGRRAPLEKSRSLVLVVP